MNRYEKYHNCPDINKIIETINDMQSLTGCHGRYHTMFVVSTLEYILQSLSYDARIIELGKIAALLHDIGSIAGRTNHAGKSAALASVFLDTSDFYPTEKYMIIQAIEDHSEATNISSAIGAAVFIADKLDITKNRVLPLEEIDPWDKNLLEIEDVKIKIAGNSITIDYITTEAFSKEQLFSTYAGKIEMIVKAAAYLGCGCEVGFKPI